jgi:lysophospholipase L1-like esterase
MRLARLTYAFLFLFFAAPVAAQTVERVATQSNLRPLPIAVHGRVERRGSDFVRQWPGTYFETAFRGSSAFFRVGPGEVSLRIRVDGRPPIPLVKPSPGFYRVGGLATGAHRLRIDVASESQAGPTLFGGYYAAPGVTPSATRKRSRAIEFIGDSHTVGYGNTSPSRQCTEEQVWLTTDTSQGIAPRLAAHEGADYQVNAISGRGIVRNYGGSDGDTLPQAYPYVLFDKKQVYEDPSWRPQLLVVALGTNDFSTPLNAGEKWKSRDELRRDFEQTYVRFIRSLRARNPRAFILLWVGDNQAGEVTSEIAKVAQRVRQSGETRLAFVPVRGLALTGCNYHPNLQDNAMVARRLARFIDSQPKIWR